MTTDGRVFVSLQIFTAASLPSTGFPGIGERVFSTSLLGPPALTDTDLLTWEQVSVNSYPPLNPAATFLLAGVHLPNGSPTYADNAILTMSIANVPQPASLGLMGLSPLALGLRARRRA